MDTLTRAYYELALQCNYLKKKGEEFQNLFSSIMEKRHPDGDFSRVRPWGKVGDRKNDGYLKSERRLFQCYAPNELTAKEAVAKIEEDFFGALEHWEEHFDTWIFVHNSEIGLGPEVLAKLLELNKTHGPEVLAWGYEDLRRKTFELAPAEIASLLGPAPSSSDLSAITFKELERVILTVGRQPVSPPEDVRPVPANKLVANGLSDNVKTLLVGGMSKSSRVAEYFAKMPEPTFGDEVVAKFKARYIELDEALSDPDEIFMELQKFAGGERRGTPLQEAAVLAVLAYLFEQCDIFKEPKQE